MPTVINGLIVPTTKPARRSSRDQLYNDVEEEGLRVSAFCTCDRFELAGIPMAIISYMSMTD
jgi:hypothetical protein